MSSATHALEIATEEDLGLRWLRGALGAALPHRLVYIVDRRAVVEQATEVAEQLRAWVQKEDAVRELVGLPSYQILTNWLKTCEMQG